MSYKITPDGNIQIPEFVLPLSKGLSPGTQEFYAGFLQSLPGSMFALTGEHWSEPRARWAPVWQMVVHQAGALFPSEISREKYGDVAVDRIRPAAGVPEANADHVIIFAHAGGFGNGQGAISEAIALAVRGNVTVLSVDYGLAPENNFKAQIHDILTVYKHTLESFRADRIALVGTSAGAYLMHLSVAQLIKSESPLPGALVLFSAGLAPDLPGSRSRGDSGAYGQAFEGFIFHGGKPPTSSADFTAEHFGDAAVSDPEFWPLNAPDLLRRFPPTLLMSATRDEALSMVLLSHRKLLAAGVTAELHVWEGLCHGFWLIPGLPESTDACDTAVKFIESHSGH